MQQNVHFAVARTYVLRLKQLDRIRQRIINNRTSTKRTVELH
eukprot:SAG31_NODE_849_length_11529_cov_3.342257_13_plen_42_part_00